MKKHYVIFTILFLSLAAQAQNPPPAAPAAPVAAPAPQDTTVDNVLSENQVTTTTTTAPAAAPAQAAKKPSPFSSEAFASAAPAAKEKQTITTKFTSTRKTFIAKVAAFLDKFNIFKMIDKVQAFVDKMKAQNVSAIEAGETGNFSAVVTKRRPATGQAKEIQDKLDKLQADKIKKYDEVN